MDLADSIWTSVGSVFGITVIETDHNVTYYSKRFLLWVIFLTGSAIFYAYQAQLTSALSVPSSKMPFRSPEDLISTDFRFA